MVRYIKYLKLLVLVSFVLILKDLITLRFAIFLQFNLLWFIFLSIILFYVLQLEKTLSENKLSFKLRNLEYASYAAFLYFLFGVIRSLISVPIVLFEGHNNIGNFDIVYSFMGKFLFTIWTFIKVGFVYFLLKTYQSRNASFGSYKTLNSYSKSFDFETKPIEKSYNSVEDRITLCKTCNLRTFNPEIGIICSLTENKPAFETTCKDYQVDNKEVTRLKNIYGKKKTGFFNTWKSAALMSVFGFLRAGMKGFDDPFGVVFLILGIGWFVFAVLNKDD
jgi:hypothetical protein